MVGGGIAGLAAAWAWTAREPGVRVCLLERERALATHATARNAAVFLPVERDEGSMRLAVRQRALLDGLFEGETRAWLRPTGAMFAAREPSRLDPVLAAARRAGLEVEPVDRASLCEALPVLAGGDVAAGLWVRGAGVLEVGAIVDRLARRCRSAGVVLRTCAAATPRRRRDRIMGVALDDGTTLDAGAVVLAGGAWSEETAARVGLGLPLTPLRRHLALLSAPLPAAAPVLWTLDDETYFRPESGGVLASPCDEDVAPAREPSVDPDRLAELGARLGRLAPDLADAPVRRAWACLRTFAPDRAAVAGPDPRVEGLSWLAGLGGQGMTLGLAVAEVAAAASGAGGAEAERGAVGAAPVGGLAAALSPGRLLGEGTPPRSPPESTAVARGAEEARAR